MKSPDVPGVIWNQWNVLTSSDCGIVVGLVNLSQLFYCWWMMLHDTGIIPENHHNISDLKEQCTVQQQESQTYHMKLMIEIFQRTLAVKNNWKFCQFSHLCRHVISEKRQIFSQLLTHFYSVCLMWRFSKTSDFCLFVFSYRNSTLVWNNHFPMSFPM